MGSMLRVKLGDVALVEISGVDKKTTEGEASVRLCNFTDVYKNWAITSSMHDSFMVASANEREIAKFSLHRGQVAVTKDSETRDDIGIPTYIADNFDDVILGYHCALITPDETQLNGKYLNAFLHTEFIHKFFSANASGSGQRYTLSIETLNSIPIYLPSLEEQERIGNIFSSIDRKIELNRQINDYLAAMARQLYDYWFVQFDFPNENGKPYKSSGGEMVWDDRLKRSIPSHWDGQSLLDVLDLFDSKRVPLSSIQRASMKGPYPYYGATGIMDYINDYIFDGEFILLAEDGSTSALDGSPIVQYIWGKNWVNNHAHIILPKDRKRIHFCFLQLKSIPAKMMETGSIQKKISQENLLKQLVVVPDKDTVSLFESIMTPLWEKKMNTTEQIIELTRQRDDLLPLLMNGQVNCQATK